MIFHRQGGTGYIVSALVTYEAMNGGANAKNGGGLGQGY